MRESQLKKAQHFGDVEQVEQLKREIEQLRLYEFHHVSGFDHPQLPIVVTDAERFKIATWGLIPNWMKDLKSGMQFSNKTLNARSETIFEKNTFKDAAIHQRCLIIVDGFYEHHHAMKKTFPYYIYLKSKAPMILAGLWNNWKDKSNGNDLNTFTIVTTKGNSLLEEIHNNPKMAAARMPVILTPELGHKWLEIDASDKAGQDEILSLCKPYDAKLMEAHTVKPIRGKVAIGNISEANQKHDYPELIAFNQSKLF